MSVSFYRTVKNIWRNGLLRSGRQIQNINDTKSGRLVGEDVHGNKFYETSDPDEIHMRTRWVEYKGFWRFDMSQVESGWHYWLAYGTDTPPNKLPVEERAPDTVPKPEINPANFSYTKGAYIPYNTARPKFDSWEPKVTERTR